MKELIRTKDFENPPEGETRRILCILWNKNGNFRKPRRLDFYPLRAML
jgi:hypothetical protein